MNDLVPRSPGLLIIRWVVIACCVGVIANSAANVVLFWLNGARVDQIQQSRADAIRVSCMDQNDRHAFAVEVTERLLARPPVPPSRSLTPQEERARRAAVRTWVNALVPERDCRKLVGRVVPSQDNR